MKLKLALVIFVFQIFGLLAIGKAKNASNDSAKKFRNAKFVNIKPPGKFFGICELEVGFNCGGFLELEVVFEFIKTVGFSVCFFEFFNGNGFFVHF